MNAIGYIRVSTLEQANNQSLDMQKKAIKLHCKSAKLKLIGFLEDVGVSGSTPLKEREAGKEAVSQLQSKKASCIVGYKLDRLFRDAEDCLRQTREFDKWGASLHLVDMGGTALDTSSAMGRCFLTVASAFSEMERNLLRERIQSALDLKKANGEKRGGRVPYGFYVVEENGKKLLKELESEQKVIRKVKRLHKKGESLRSIARILEEKGLMNRSDNKWFPQSIKRILESTVTASLS